eukprot:COSAG02_NODE_3527_length_6612_cov_15.879011_5_plen_150_part_00
MWIAVWMGYGEETIPSLSAQPKRPPPSFPTSQASLSLFTTVLCLGGGELDGGEAGGELGGGSSRASAVARAVAVAVAAYVRRSGTNMKPTPPATASTSTSLLHALKTPMLKKPATTSSPLTSTGGLKTRRSLPSPLNAMATNVCTADSE